MSTMPILCLCYQSISEPLTQTQVVPYLEELTTGGDLNPSMNRDKGIEASAVVLLTFEPHPLSSGEEERWQRKLATKGIEWHWVRYCKRSLLPATALDILVGFWTA